jgi:peptidoglycan/xylan/chitin deacetylase (PgdA/CDA1 family)
MLTIVMYHYVRDLPNTRYPEIKGLLTSRFDGQLDYIQKHYEVLDIGGVIRALREGTGLPSNGCLLTFDDGLSDHYETVFPRLTARGISGSFYPSVTSALDHVVLAAHKIHFILASGASPELLRAAIFEELATYRGRVELPSGTELLTRNAIAQRFDGPDVIFVKRMLQMALPEWIRNEITARLFARFVSEDEATFARGLYMTVEQMRGMVAADMLIGGHGDRHNWLGTLEAKEQEADIVRTRSFLAQIYGAPPVDWVECYPYGSYNEVTIGLLAKHRAALALTINTGIEPDLSRPFELKRIDTNDLPCNGNAEPAEWTVRAAQAS